MASFTALALLEITDTIKHSMPKFTTKDKILFLRSTRMGRLPPAMHAATIAVEAGLPVLALEYAEPGGKTEKVESTVLRRRLSCACINFFPRKLRPIATLFYLTGYLSWAFLKEGRPAVLVTQGIQEQALALLLNLIFRVPIIAQVHEIYEPRDLSRMNRFFLWFEGPCLRRADRVLSPEKTRSEWLVSRYQLAHSPQFVPNCPRLTDPKPHGDFRAELQIPKNDLVMLYLGGIGANVPLEEAIQALVAFPNLHFVLVGWGNSEFIERLKARAKTLELSSRVHFTGATDDKWKYYHGADIAFCVYQPNEIRTRFQATASNKLFEAMACGVPVIVRNTPDFTSLLAECPVGVVTETNSAKAIEQALSPLVADENLRKKLGAAGKASFEKQFHFESFFRVQYLLPAHLTSLEFSDDNFGSKSSV